MMYKSRKRLLLSMKKLLKFCKLFHIIDEFIEIVDQFTIHGYELIKI